MKTETASSPVRRRRRNRRPDPNRTPVAYGYARVSHPDSYNKNESVPAQVERVQEYYESNLKGEGVKWGGCKDDGRYISAYKVGFEARPAGREIMGLLQPGDHLIVDKVDRFWRSNSDFAKLIQRFDSMGITVHIVSFLSQPVQSNSAMGRFILQFFVMTSELESSLKSERIKQAIQTRRRKGDALGCVLPGTKIENVYVEAEGRTKKKLVWDEDQRALMKLIVRLLDDERKFMPDAFDEIEAFQANIENRKPHPPSYRNWYRQEIWRKMYRYEVAFEYLGITHPADIPHQDAIMEAARQHKERRRYKRAVESGEKMHKPALLSPEEILAMHE